MVMKIVADKTCNICLKLRKTLYIRINGVFKAIGVICFNCNEIEYTLNPEKCIQKLKFVR